jgi:hypothetical protein
MQGDNAIWYEDLPGFAAGALEFVPSRDMSVERQLNATLRFSIYFALAAFVLRRDGRVWILPLATAIVTYAIYRQSPERYVTLEDDADSPAAREAAHEAQLARCTAPTVDNPFMNMRVADLAADPERAPACSLARRSVAHKAQAFFNRNLFRSIGDVFEREASDRQFYTMPVTEEPSDQNAFAQYCFGEGLAASCRGGDKWRCVSDLTQRPGMA